MNGGGGSPPSGSERKGARMGVDAKHAVGDLLVALLTFACVCSAEAGEAPQVDPVPVPVMKAAVDSTLDDCGLRDGCFSIDGDKVVRRARGSQDVWATE